MIALKEDSKDYMLDLYKVMTDEKIVNALKGAKSPVQIKEIILKNTLPAN